MSDQRSQPLSPDRTGLKTVLYITKGLGYGSGGVQALGSNTLKYNIQTVR